MQMRTRERPWKTSALLRWSSRPRCIACPSGRSTTFMSRRWRSFQRSPPAWPDRCLVLSLVHILSRRFIHCRSWYTKIQGEFCYTQAPDSHLPTLNHDYTDSTLTFGKQSWLCQARTSGCTRSADWRLHCESHQTWFLLSTAATVVPSGLSNQPLCMQQPSLWLT